MDDVFVGAAVWFVALVCCVLFVLIFMYLIDDVLL